MSGRFGKHRRRSISRRCWPERRAFQILAIVVVFMVVGASVGAGIQLSRTTPPPTFHVSLPAAIETVPNPTGGPLSWPAVGEADLVLPGVLSFAPAGFTNSVPIASLTKVMTTLVLLQDYPLAPGETGPIIMVTDTAVVDTAVKLADNATVLPILAGERLSEAQAIQAMLVTSANNIADLVAAWDAGSQSAFVAKMNALAAAWGLSSTHFDDPSGLSADSRSSAADVLTLAQRALRDPLIRTDVALTSAVLPYAPNATTTTSTTATDRNTPSSPPAPPAATTTTDPLSAITEVSLANSDTDLGKNGIIGIKTGYDSAAGGCFLFAAQVTTGTSTQVAYGVVLGQQATSAQRTSDHAQQLATDSLQAALDEAVVLVTGLQRVLNGVTLLNRGQVLGTVQEPWGSAAVVAAQSVSVVARPGTAVAVQVHFIALRASRQVRANEAVGHLIVQIGITVDSVALVTRTSIPSPSIGWRLTRP
jgi:D-alanyl-D-alanine carboxypeptidase (penicillin-binding protein 5/6)